jgi:hypothetical protein
MSPSRTKRPRVSRIRKGRYFKSRSGLADFEIEEVSVIEDLARAPS